MYYVIGVGIVFAHNTIKVTVSNGLLTISTHGWLMYYLLLITKSIDELFDQVGGIELLIEIEQMP